MENHKHEEGQCSCCCEQELENQELLTESENFIQLVDEETGETFDFTIADEFDFEDKEYVVLLTLDENPEYVIAAKVEDEDGMYVESLSSEMEDIVYDEYSRLLAEEFGE